VLTVGIAAGEPSNTRLLSFAGFALGMGAVLTVIAIAAALTSETVTISRTLLRLVPRLAGAIALAGAIVILGRELQLVAVALHQEPPTPRTAYSTPALVATALVGVAAATRHDARGSQIHSTADPEIEDSRLTP
jgi:hypothetical protein